VFGKDVIYDVPNAKFMEQKKVRRSLYLTQVLQLIDPSSSNPVVQRGYGMSNHPEPLNPDPSLDLEYKSAFTLTESVGLSKEEWVDIYRIVLVSLIFEAA